MLASVSANALNVRVPPSISARVPGVPASGPLDGSNEEKLQMQKAVKKVENELLSEVLDSFGVLASRLSENTWTSLRIGLGGQVAGRSAEKITKQSMGARSAETAGPGGAKG